MITGIILFLIALIVTLIGFGPGGIAAGSIAAGVHSYIGIVSAGSLFAIF